MEEETSIVAAVDGKGRKASKAAGKSGEGDRVSLIISGIVVLLLVSVAAYYLMAPQNAVSTTTVATTTASPATTTIPLGIYAGPAIAYELNASYFSGGAPAYSVTARSMDPSKAIMPPGVAANDLLFWHSSSLETSMDAAVGNDVPVRASSSAYIFSRANATLVMYNYFVDKNRDLSSDTFNVSGIGDGAAGYIILPPSSPNPAQGPSIKTYVIVAHYRKLYFTTRVTVSANSTFTAGAISLAQTLFDAMLPYSSYFS